MPAVRIRPKSRRHRSPSCWQSSRPDSGNSALSTFTTRISSRMPGFQARSQSRRRSWWRRSRAGPLLAVPGSPLRSRRTASAARRSLPRRAWPCSRSSGTPSGADAGMLGDLRESRSLVPVPAEDQHGAVEDLAASLVGPAMPLGLVLDFLELHYSHTISFGWSSWGGHSPSTRQSRLLNERIIRTGEWAQGKARPSDFRKCPESLLGVREGDSSEPQR